MFKQLIVKRTFASCILLLATKISLLTEHNRLRVAQNTRNNGFIGTVDTTHVGDCFSHEISEVTFFAVHIPGLGRFKIISTEYMEEYLLNKLSVYNKNFRIMTSENVGSSKITISCNFTRSKTFLKSYA